MINNRFSRDGSSDIVGKGCFSEIHRNHPGCFICYLCCASVCDQDLWLSTKREEMWEIVTLEACTTFHVISTNIRAVIFTGVSRSYFGRMALGHVYSDWRVACLSEAVATLCQPALVQDHWGNDLVCLAAIFYACTLWLDQG